MRKTSIVSIGILLMISVGVVLQIPMVKGDEPYWYNPSDSTIQDNAFNKTDYFSLQWWYIDAMFTNNYSTHIGILSMSSQGKYGFFILQISVYKEMELVERGYRFVPLQHMQISPDEPILKFQGSELLKSYYDQNNHVCLSLNIGIQTIQVNLTFTGVRKGWKGNTGLGMWGCPLPKADVIGSLRINGNDIAVQGTGYQERGWDVRSFHKSWYWGKFSSASDNIIFSQNMHNRWQEDLFLVMVNTGADKYTSIHRENITFTHMNYRLIHGRFISMVSVFKAHEKTIDINVTLEVKSIDYHRLAILGYWRFHVQVSGTIVVDGVPEVVDEVQIMEICHFL
jgi:hypothetical protein